MFADEELVMELLINADRHVLMRWKPYVVPGKKTGRAQLS